MKTVNVKTIPEDKLQDLYNDEDLTLAAKYVYLMLYFGMRILILVTMSIRRILMSYMIKGT